MRRVALLGAILLSAIWVIALYAGNPNDSIRGSERETTVQGCLDISGLTYTLTLPSGAVFQMTGNTASLKAHVGEALQVRGIASPVMNEPGSMSEGEQCNPVMSNLAPRH